jgi:hypothetical protein
MIAFRVHESSGNTVEVTGEFKVVDSGALVVKPHGEAPFVMSPSGWLRIDFLDVSTGLGEVLADLRAV